MPRPLVDGELSELVKADETMWNLSDGEGWGTGGFRVPRGFKDGGWDHVEPV